MPRLPAAQRQFSLKSNTKGSQSRAESYRLHMVQQEPSMPGLHTLTTFGDGLYLGI